MSLRLARELPGASGRPDLVVVGSGVVGLATAFFTSRLGLRVLILERMRAPTSLTSRRSGEGVRGQWGLPQNIALARESIDIYAGFADLTGHAEGAGYRAIGYLYGSRTAAGAAALRRRVAQQRAAGLDDLVFLDGPALHACAPLLAEDATGAAFRQRDGVVSLDRIAAGYKVGMAADLLLDTAVTDIVPGRGGVVVRTTRGDVAAGAVVIAAGAKSIGLLAAFPHAPRMRTARASIVRVNVDGVPPDHPTIIDTDVGSFWRPDEGGARLTASFAGTLLVPDGEDDPQPEPGYLDRALATAIPLTPRWREWSAALLDSHLRTGTYAITVDGAPVIGPVPEAPGVYVNGGYGGHGVMMSPGGGRLLAAMVASGRHDPANPFAAERFSDGRPLPPEPMTIHLTDTPT